MLDFLVEKKIQEAMACGAFDDLPGAGQPLELNDDALVPEELRVAFRILKNAGFVPPEVEALNEIAALERLAMGGATAVKKLALLKVRVEARYFDKAVARLGR